MLLLILTAAGVTLAVIEILVSEYNDETHSNMASWISGCYMALGVVQFIGQQYLIAILSTLPTISILVVKLVRRISHAERV